MKYVHLDDIELTEEEYSDMSFATITSPERIRWQAEIETNLKVITELEEAMQAAPHTGPHISMRRYGRSAQEALTNLINAIQEEGWGVRE